MQSGTLFPLTLSLSLGEREQIRSTCVAVFDKYFAPIPGPVMITAANVIQGGARIARAKPHLADQIAA